MIQARSASEWVCGIRVDLLAGASYSFFNSKVECDLAPIRLGVLKGSGTIFSLHVDRLNCSYGRKLSQTTTTSVWG
ncbi:MAG: hypothetical protein ABGX16_13115 [Pirellulales bacterium]